MFRMMVIYSVNEKGKEYIQVKILQNHDLWNIYCKQLLMNCLAYITMRETSKTKIITISIRFQSVSIQLNQFLYNYFETHSITLNCLLSQLLWKLPSLPSHSVVCEHRVYFHIKKILKLIFNIGFNYQCNSYFLNLISQTLHQLLCLSFISLSRQWKPQPQECFAQPHLAAHQWFASNPPQKQLPA